MPLLVSNNKDTNNSLQTKDLQIKKFGFWFYYLHYSSQIRRSSENSQELKGERRKKSQYFWNIG